MMYKRHVLLIALLLLSGYAFSQAQWGLKAGPGFADMVSRSGHAKESTLLIASFSAGAFADVPLSGAFFLEPQLQLEGKGGKNRLDEGHTRLLYLVLPVDIGYKLRLKKGAVLLGAGPYAGYGLHGRSDATDMNGNELGHSDPFSGIGGLRRLDAGAHVQAAYVIDGHWRAGLQASLGIADLERESQEDRASVHNTAFVLYLGYEF